MQVLVIRLLPGFVINTSQFITRTFNVEEVNSPATSPPFILWSTFGSLQTEPLLPLGDNGKENLHLRGANLEQNPAHGGRTPATTVTVTKIILTCI